MTMNQQKPIKPRTQDSQRKSLLLGKVIGSVIIVVVIIVMGKKNQQISKNKHWT